MRRAVLMIVDGLRADMVTPALTPTLARIAAGARVFTRQRSVFPSATRVNSASIATGCHPASHGLAGNAIALDEGEGLRPVSVGPPGFRERLRRATGRTLHRPTLTQRLAQRGGAVIYSNSSAGAAHMQDPDGHGTLYHRDGSHAPGFQPITGEAHLAVTYDATGDTTTTERFAAALAAPDETELFVTWICEPDHSQHALELGSPEHRTVLAGADACIARVAEAVGAMRARGDDVLFVLGSDHGHETVDEVVPVTELLVDAGLKASMESSDVVLASSGMGALVYFAPEAADRRQAVGAWLRAQPWAAEVFVGPELAAVGQATDTALGVAFAMAKRDAPNRFGVRGLGHVAADPFMSSDARGLGQHGGLGPYETNPFLVLDGGGHAPGRSDAPSATVDIAPTIAAWLGIPTDGMDGRPLR
ncbi:MAG: alkaline phosphatase family protein [Ectothiorhodospiraceae bacterium]|nr:alkaline phosphatase family protein [Ectothiorhodospiraceae bacterium]